MLDQLNQMQQVTVPPTFPSFALVASYTIGPIDPAHLTACPVQLSTGQDIMLLLPVHLPVSVRSHPAFKEGSEWGYLEADDTRSITIPRLLNTLEADLSADLSPEEDEDDPQAYPWMMGLLLGELARLAETDRTLALVGLAHLCLLASVLTQRRPADWPRYEPYSADALHRSALKAYRARVRAYRNQGQSFEQAQRSALLPCACVCWTLPEARLPQPIDPLALLRAHPAFQRGLAVAQATFLHEYEPAPLTEEEMIDEVEERLSREGFELNQICHQARSVTPYSYLFYLGVTVGTIGQGLSYIK